MELKLTKILNRVQVLSTKKVYTYNKMERINSKPALQAGNENLIEYNVSLQLHSNFCNPKKVIEFLEEQASSRDFFEWMYHDEYMGTFVIDSIDKVIENQIQGIVIYAEVTLNLLEFPLEEEFLEQIQNTVDLSNTPQYSETSSKFKNFAAKVKNSVTTNIKNTIESIANGNILLTENLSDAAKDLLKTASTSILNDITGKNISALYSTTTSWIDRIQGISSLTPSEIIDITNAVRSIPDKVVNTVLRRESF